MVDFNAPVAVIYHPTSGIPAEFCEFSETFEADLPWILDNCPEAISPDKLAKVMAKELAKASLGEGESAPAGAAEKKESVKGAGITIKKAKAGPGECRVIISRVQRQKKKFITSVVGMETIPDVKLKDAAKVFGKKFASGASVSTNAAGDDEITIQGDVQFDLPALLMSQFKVPPTSIYFQDKDKITAFA
jgi:density-regulated protein DRP1